MQVPAFASPGDEVSKASGGSSSYFPLIRTFAYALLASSLFSLFATLGLSFLSSLMMLSAACVLLCARKEQLDYEVQCVHAAGGGAGKVSFFCPQRGSVAHRKLNDVHGLALAAIIFGCLEVIASVTLFTTAGIPFTGRFSNNVLRAQPPFFSRFPGSWVNGALETFQEWNSAGNVPTLPAFPIAPSYVDADGW